MRSFLRLCSHLGVVAVFAAVGGFVAVSLADGSAGADRGGMSAGVPMMSLAEVAAMANGLSSADLATTTISPVRIVDTRVGAASLGGSKVPWGPLETRTIEAAGLGPIPSDAAGVVVNVTALNATAVDTFLTLFPTGDVMPNASTLNPVPGEVAFNAATVLLGPDGTFEVYNYSGDVDVIVDVTAYLTRSLADDVGRLQTGALLPSLKSIAGVSYGFTPDGFSEWSNYNFYDQSGLFGAPIEEGRFSSSAQVELRVALQSIQRDDFEVCFRIFSTVDGPIEESEVCIDSSSSEAADGYVAAVTPRVALPAGTLNPHVKVRLRSGATCSVDYTSQCRGVLEWFGFYVFDS